MRIPDNNSWYERKLVWSLLQKYHKGIIDQKELHNTLCSYILRMRKNAVNGLIEENRERRT